MIDLHSERQLVPGRQSHSDHDLVGIAERVGLAHCPVRHDPRQSSDPSRQMVMSVRHLTAASELLLWIVDEKFGEDGQ